MKTYGWHINLQKLSNWMNEPMFSLYLKPAIEILPFFKVMEGDNLIRQKQMETKN